MAISIVKPSIGGDVGVWGTELNAALDALVSGVNQALNTLASVPGTYATQQALTIAVNGLSAQLAGKVDAAQWGTIESEIAAKATPPASGTASDTTFWRGDGTWATPPGGGAAITTDSDPDGTPVLVIG